MRKGNIVTEMPVSLIITLLLIAVLIIGIIALWSGKMDLIRGIFP